MPIATILIVLQLGFWIFDATSCTGNQCGILIQNTTQYNSSFAFAFANTTNQNTTSATPNLWDVVINPSNLGGTDFLNLLVGLVFASAAISAGLYYIFRTDLIIIFPLFTAILGFGSIPIINLYNLISRESYLFGCTTGILGCFPAQILSIFVGILGIWWLWACISWWTGREST